MPVLITNNSSYPLVLASQGFDFKVRKNERLNLTLTAAFQKYIWQNITFWLSYNYDTKCFTRGDHPVSC